MSKAKTFDGSDAVHRLGELGPDVGVFNTAARAGLAAAGECTGNDPVLLRGLLLFCKIVRSIREQLVVDGWSVEETRNLPLTVRPNMKIMVARGNRATGCTDGRDPETKRTRGRSVYEELRGQGIDESELIADTEFWGALRHEPSTTEVWVLLYYPVKRDRNGGRVVVEVRTELSLPYEMHQRDDKISSWKERILLPSVAVAG